jgi:hypothetical protein
MTAGDRFQSWGRRRESSVGQCSKEERNAGLDSGFRPNPEEDAERVARLRLQDEAEAAAKAQVFFQISHAGHEVSLGNIGALPYRHARTIAQRWTYLHYLKVTACLTTPNPNLN